MELNTQRRRVFSGIQPTGLLHIGNYFGALQRWLLEQDAKDCFYCIVDMHAITIPQDPEKLKQATLKTAALYLAVGLNPQKSIIYVQSHVPAHAELCWVLNCMTPVGWLERMTQYKTKAAEMESVNTGLLDYPVLQTADILLFDANEVPVGEDQKQHVELARDIAQRFNYLYGETFVIPEVVLPQTGARIRALNDPSRKMSKSEAHIPGHAIRLVDEPDEIRLAIQHAVTDSGKDILFSDNPDKAGVNNLLEIYQLCTGMSRSEIESHFTGRGYRFLKSEVAEEVIEILRPIREKYHQWMNNPGDIENVLTIGARTARQITELKFEQVRNNLGFLPRK